MYLTCCPGLLNAKWLAGYLTLLSLFGHQRLHAEQLNCLESALPSIQYLSTEPSCVAIYCCLNAKILRLDTKEGLMCCIQS